MKKKSKDFLMVEYAKSLNKTTAELNAKDMYKFYRWCAKKLKLIYAERKLTNE